MLADIFLWLAPSPGLFMTVIGAVCFITSFVYLVKVLYDNASDESMVDKHRKDEVQLHAIESRSLKVSELPDIEEMTEFMYEEGEQEGEADDVTATVFTHTSSDRVKLMNDTAPMIIEYWDRDYNLVDYNKTAAIFNGIASAPERAFGLDEIDLGLSHQPSGELTRVMWANALSKTFEDGFLKFEYVTEKNGKTLYLDVTARCIRTSSGDVVVTYSSDVSATKEMIREKELKAIAEANSHAKSRFLAHMSHELRTPISAVLGIAEIQLHNQELTAEAEEAFGQIYRSSSTLVGILNDILDLSKIEAGKMELIPKKYQVTGMIHDVAQMHAMTLETKSFKFNLNVDASLPTELIGDELRIKQVLNNLLSNAFKYTEEGMVQFSAKREEANRDNYANIVFTIKDTGRGMTQEQVSKLLNEDYVRFNEDSNVTGTGLGISIVQVLVKLMDATMEIDSTPGKGTTVTITIPQQMASSETIGKAAAVDLEKLKGGDKKLNFEPVSMAQRRVMVVDDILSNLYVARGLLELYDLQVETHDSALPAISGVRRGEVYDIIFMDYMMPGIDGIEATKMLRDMKYTGPIVALTANALVGQEEIFLENGFDDFLSKPIRTTALHEILIKYIKNQEEVPEVENVQSDDYYSSPDVVRMVVKDFLDTQNMTIIEMEEAIKVEDLESGQRLAHTTKNLAIMLKESSLASIAQEIEISFAKKEIPSNLMLLNFARELGQVYEKLQEAQA